MLILEALRERRTRRLWLGQVGSSVGDEFYRMAFVWLAVQILGADTGYATALQMAVVVLFGVFLGGFGDRFRADRVMIGVDLIRAILSLVPAVLFLAGKPSYPALLAATVLMGALGTYFDPALQGSLPALLGEARLLRAANGLMGTTYRLARVLGPGCVALLSGWVPIHHFFTINSISYLLSALSIRSLHREYGAVPATPGQEGLHWFRSFREMRSDHRIFQAYLFKSICGGVWGAVYLVGFALLARRFDPGGMGAFGAVTAAYGIGNIVSVVLIGARESRLGDFWIYAGYFLVGASFVGMASAESLFSLCAFSAMGALGGPMSDLPFIEMLQERYPARSLKGLVRLRMISETLFYLVFMLLSPLAFRRIGVPAAVSWAGAVCMLLSVVFHLRSRRPSGGRIPWRS